MIITRDYTVTTSYKLHACSVFVPDLKKRFNNQAYVERVNRMVKSITSNEVALNQVFTFTVATAYGIQLAGNATFLECLMSIRDVFQEEDSQWLVFIHESNSISELKPLERCFFATRNGVRIEASL